MRPKGSGREQPIPAIGIGAKARCLRRAVHQLIKLSQKPNDLVGQCVAVGLVSIKEPQRGLRRAGNRLVRLAFSCFAKTPSLLIVNFGVQAVPKIRRPEIFVGAVGIRKLARGPVHPGGVRPCKAAPLAACAAPRLPLVQGQRMRYGSSQHRDGRYYVLASPIGDEMQT